MSIEYDKKKKQDSWEEFITFNIKSYFLFSTEIFMIYVLIN